jgi:exoribonuclease II
VRPAKPPDLAIQRERANGRQKVTKDKLEAPLQSGSLVLYKHDPARVASVGAKKLQIELPDDETLSVRPKDVTLFHPGPMESLDALGDHPAGEIKTAWELLSGGETTLPELAELAYGAYTPTTAWAAWQVVSDGLYFQGSPDEIIAHTPEEVEAERAAREARAAEKRAWEEFLSQTRAILRASSGEEPQKADLLVPEYEPFLRDVEMLAFGYTDSSNVLQELGRSASPEDAHAILLKLGYWDHTVVPYPQRLDLPSEPPTAPLPDLPEEARIDLTHLPAFAIDDEGTKDPDDAISLEETSDGRRLWVHIADVSALVTPESEADLEARARGSTLYLPDGNVPMLPTQAARRLGMGIEDKSPALSFGLDLSPEGEILGVEIVLSWVQVKRLTYDEANALIEAQEEPLWALYQAAHVYQERRRENGAIRLDLPEVKVRVNDGRVSITPLPALKSRDLVREAMLMTGEATAQFALEQGIPLPFATQSPPDTDERPDDLAGMYELRRHMNRSQHSSHPAPHAGLGLEAYVRATSPLRRYLDLVTHQQLRDHLRGEEPLEMGKVVNRIGETEAVSGRVHRAERLSKEHWKLVYLIQHPDWRGEGVLVERWNRRGTVLIPELAIETKVNLRQNRPLNDTVTLALVDVNLAELEAHFRPKRS